MKDLIKVILFFVGLFVITHIVYVVSDWVSANVSPVIIYLGIVGMFAIGCYVFLKEVE